MVMSRPQNYIKRIILSLSALRRAIADASVRKYFFDAHSKPHLPE